MSLKAEINTWVQALEAYDAQDYDRAIAIFQTIGDSARILTNIGLTHAVLGEHDKAVENFNSAITLDRYLAVAYFQCGVSNFLLGQFELAVKDFDDAIENLRGNESIKYPQLGLDFTLHLAELLFNRGLSQINLGLMEEGVADLRMAIRAKATPEHEVIDECLRNQGEGFTVFSIPLGVLFRPSQMKVANLSAKDYLGKARLVAADDPRNAYTGFTGTELLKRGEGPTGVRVLTTVVDDRPPAAALVDIPRSADEWIPPAVLTRSTSAGSGSIARSATTLRRNHSAGNPVTPATMTRSMSLARPGMMRSPNAAPLKALPPAPSLAAIYDNYMVDSAATPPTAASRAYPSSGLGITISRTPSRAASRQAPRRRATASRRGDPMPKSRFTDTSYEDDEAYGSGEDLEYPPAELSKIRVKLHFKEDVRGMAIPPDMPYNEFSERVRTKFGTAKAPLMKFADEDGAKVSLVDSMDFELAIETAREGAKGKAEGRLEIWCSAD